MNTSTKSQESTLPSTFPTSRNRLISAGEVTLHYVEAGDVRHPTIVFLHGYPDCHKVWSHQLESLAKNFHVVSFDMRGVGLSTRTYQPKEYKIDNILKDIDCVITEAVGKEGKVHLVGHDWGSVLGWSFVANPVLSRRIISWTSVSGPHLGLLLAHGKELLRSKSLAGYRQYLGQMFHSYYIFIFQVPKLIEAVVRRQGAFIWRQVLRQGGVKASDPYLNVTQKEVENLMLHTVNLYRENFFTPPRAPEENSIDVPTQLIIPDSDSFVRPYIFDSLSKYVRQLTVQNIKGNHWIQRINAEEIGSLISTFAKSNPE